MSHEEQPLSSLAKARTLRPNAVSRALKAIDADALIAAEPSLRVREARSEADMDAVYRITHDAYVVKGYCTPQPDGRLVHYPHLDGIPETTVYVAELDGEIVGTNAVTLDGPNGLHVDHDFKDECDAIRAEGRRLAASWRIATRENLRSDTRVVMALIQETIRFWVMNDLDTCVCTFNPRHERIYKRLLNMVTVATRFESVAGLSNAPAVFMRLDLANIPDRWLDTPQMKSRMAALRERHAAQAVA
ncbi:MAG: hypothetical protein KIS92_14670 [Planctomycetota bacterium]|nr:hypothetical protein [Planctomycetota bacterium]